MFYTHKAYLNSRGGPVVLNLTHDVKRALADSKTSKGHVHITATYGTTGIMLMENDPDLQNEHLNFIEKLFAELPKNSVARRSRTGANKFHQMAAMCGLTLTIPFENGRLLSSPFHEIVAMDFEPGSGRREFIISISGGDAAQGAGPGGPMMPGMR